MHSTAQHSTAQHSTQQHSTAQHSTAQHSIVQHSTAQHVTGNSNVIHTADPASRLLCETSCLLPLACVAQQICSALRLQVPCRTQLGSGHHWAQGQVVCPPLAGSHVTAVVLAHAIHSDGPADHELGYLQGSPDVMSSPH